MTKLILAIVKDVAADLLMTRLVESGYRVTRIASTGGFLRQGNTTLLIGINADQEDAVLALLRQCCGPAEAGQHRATLFILNAAGYMQV